MPRQVAGVTRLSMVGEGNSSIRLGEGQNRGSLSNECPEACACRNSFSSLARCCFPARFIL